jgi:alanine dehydrogenase
MPGAVPNTSTYALTNATLPYLRSIANNGWHAALKSDPSLRLGLNTHAGAVTNAPVAQATGLEYSDLDAIFA